MTSNIRTTRFLAKSLAWVGRLPEDPAAEEDAVRADSSNAGRERGSCT